MTRINIALPIFVILMSITGVGAYAATSVDDCENATDCNATPGCYISGWTCDRCKKGTYKGAGDTSCIQCNNWNPQPTWSDLTGMTSVSECSWTSLTCGGGYGFDTNNGCTQCSAGTYKAGATYYPGSGSDNCSPCSDNYYSAAGATQCTACSKGTQGKTDHTGCDNCNPGYYNDTPGGYCKQCQDGKYSEKPGATQCQACTDFYSITNPKKTQCIPACKQSQIGLRKANDTHTQCVCTNGSIANGVDTNNHPQCECTENAQYSVTSQECVCKPGYKKDENNSTQDVLVCKPKIIKLTLFGLKNGNNNVTIYQKYDTGLSRKEDDDASNNWSDCVDMTAEDSQLIDTFNGYYIAEYEKDSLKLTTKVVGNVLSLCKTSDSSYLSEDTTLDTTKDILHKVFQCDSVVTTPESNELTLKGCFKLNKNRTPNKATTDQGFNCNKFNNSALSLADYLKIPDEESDPNKAQGKLSEITINPATDYDACTPPTYGTSTDISSANTGLFFAILTDKTPQSGEYIEGGNITPCPVMHTSAGGPTAMGITACKLNDKNSRFCDNYGCFGINTNKPTFDFSNKQQEFQNLKSNKSK